MDKNKFIKIIKKKISNKFIKKIIKKKSLLFYALSTLKAEKF
jgi:hypothetical protein